MSAAHFLYLPALVLCSLAVGVFAQDQRSGEAAIEAREDLMHSNASVMQSAGEATGADAVTAGETLVANFLQLPDLFPEDSKEGETRALPLIWEDMEGFQAEIAAAQEAAQAVLDAANADDAETFTAAIQAMGDRCDSCHSKYRAES